MTKYSKPFLPPSEQIKLLQSRGMNITDIAKAEECLKRIGYYRLSAYWYPFRQQIEKGGKKTVLDDFKPNIHFSTCLELYVFDKKLRLLTLDALERIEVAVRTDIAILLGERDVEAHRNPALLHGNFTKKKRRWLNNQTEHEAWLAKLDASTGRSKEEFVSHFKQKYPDSELPIWIAVELWDFGMLSNFFKGMSVKDKDIIAGKYGLPSGQIFETWLRCLNVTRNICAHHSRLWNRPFVAQPIWPAKGIQSELDIIAGDTHSLTRFYAVALILKVLLQRVNPTSSWFDRLMKHAGTLPRHEVISLRQAGFPSK